MPTLTELQRQRPTFPIRPEPPTFTGATFTGEEVIADSRASMRPSQFVEQKLEARTLRTVHTSRFAAVRPRAK